MNLNLEADLHYKSILEITSYMVQCGMSENSFCVLRHWKIRNFYLEMEKIFYLRWQKYSKIVDILGSKNCKKSLIHFLCNYKYISKILYLF
jgi:hypothetical protein